MTCGIRNVEYLRGEYEQIKVVVCENDFENVAFERWGKEFYDEIVPEAIAESCVEAFKGLSEKTG